MICCELLKMVRIYTTSVKSFNRDQHINVFMFYFWLKLIHLVEVVLEPYRLSIKGSEHRVELTLSQTTDHPFFELMTF